jgi:hypothetical protein
MFVVPVEFKVHFNERARTFALRANH